MEQKIFLEENRNVFATNVENTIDVGLSTKTHLLPNNNIDDTFSLYEQYNKERDNCNKFRVLLTVNPVCSNILFNMKTEIMMNEGSSACTVIRDTDDNEKYGIIKKSSISNNSIVNSTEDITYLQAIRDTEYSHKKNGQFVYHCGADIFNNHMLRNNGFVHINMIQNGDKTSSSVYNTIFDTLRDNNGHIVQEITDKRVSNANWDEKKNLHLYYYDQIQSVKDAFSEKCLEKDGWWGFTNPGNINIPNSSAHSDVLINRMMANNKPCEFIDMYPDRELFSFIPKYNKYRHRTEKNWDYCLTYPYESDYNVIKQICGGDNDAIRADFKVVQNEEYLLCNTYFKHTLKSGSYVRIYYYSGDTFTKYSAKVSVYSVGDANGDNTDRYFTIKKSAVSSIFSFITENSCLYYKKIDDGTECSYYMRKFKKIKNINGEELKSDVNKIAFGKNIYGDDVAQITFLDDVNLEGLNDNNGRPVSKIYLTIVKRNAGYKLWYNEVESECVYSSSAIEYSHCFGKVTSGLDFEGLEKQPVNYNARKLHNIHRDLSMDSGNETAIGHNSYSCVTNTLKVWGAAALENPKPIEDDITIDNDVFYGDVIEFNNATYTETQIGTLYHRVNTAQRECYSDFYENIYQDVITSDDYDFTSAGTSAGFSVSTFYMNDMERPKYNMHHAGHNISGGTFFFGNINPEGYIYNPYTEIKLKEESDTLKTSEAKYINYTDASVDGNLLTFTVPTNYGFYKGDTMALYNIETQTCIWAEIFKVSGNVLTLKSDLVSSSMTVTDSINKTYYGFWSSDSVPSYAKLNFSTGRFVWRMLTPLSELQNTKDLYNMPFSNGRLYVHKNINFFLKRQDPRGDYWLSYPSSGSGTNQLLNFVMNGYSKIDFSSAIYFLDNLTQNCY